MKTTFFRNIAAILTVGLISVFASTGAWAEERRDAGDGPRSVPGAHARDDDRDHDRDRHHRKPAPAACSIDAVISFFDASVANGTLIGAGPGESARGRLKALRNKLSAAELALRAGNVPGARNQLLGAYERTVGAPPAFVAGPAAAELASRIMAAIQCLAGDRPPIAQVVNNTNGLLAKAWVGAVEFTENLAFCGSGCSTGFLDVAEGANAIAVQPLTEVLARQIGALGPFARNISYAVNIIRPGASYCAELWIRHQTASTFNDDTTRELVSSICEPALPPSTTLSGTAAAGAAIVGVVTVRDSSVPFQERSAPIGDAGRYSIDVAGMTAPFMLRADGNVGLQSYSIYSAAVAGDVGGTVNITPLTDLIISNIAGQIAAAAYAAGDFGAITPASLIAAQAELLAKLEPVLIDLGISTSVDILRAAFNADHTGMDLLLDALRVEVDPVAQSAIITNIVNASQTTDNFATLDPTGTLTGGGTATGLAEFDQVLNVFRLWTDAFATSLPSPETLWHLFDPAFTFEGSTRDAFLTMLTTDPLLIGLNVSRHVALESIGTAAFPYTATVSFIPEFAGRMERPMRMNLAKASASSYWLMTGDGRVGQAMVIAAAEYWPSNPCPGAPPIRTGLKVEITSPLDLNVDYALVKGPGLPAAGALWFKVPSDDHFHVAAVGAPYNGADTTRACGDPYFLDDTAIASIPDNAAYTIELWGDAGTVANTTDDVKLHEYTETLPKGPLLNAGLTAASFPAFTAENSVEVAAFGGTLNASWTLPANMFSNSLDFHRGQSVDPMQYSVDQQLTATATSAAIAGIPAPSGTVTYYSIALKTTDVFAREYRIGVNH